MDEKVYIYCVLFLSSFYFQFKFNAKFNKELNCYEAVNIFGYVPCKVAPPNVNAEDWKAGQIYEITAIENIHLPGQTLFFHGEFVQQVNVGKNVSYYHSLFK